ncbi:MAG: dihydrodipicolinate synthase family protein [Propionibacteriales bacterium]|nr:dihydrodipicolinate synthase family protein [Propionibacteriales bacterium]
MSTSVHLRPGLWAVLATPFTGPEVDEGSLAREVRAFVDAGAVGLVALGVFGEAAALSSDEQRRVVERVVATAPETPLVVGLSGRTTAVAVEQGVAATRAAGAPLAALMVQVNSPDPETLATHLRAVHEATGAPVVVQDYPVASGVSVTPDQLLETLARCPFVAALKSEAPPTALAISRLTAHTSVPVFGGLGGVALIDELTAGAAGAMTGFSHPQALSAVLAAWHEGGFDGARAAWAPWLPLATFEGQPRVGLALRKELLRRRGVIDESGVRAPAPGLPAELLPLLEQHLAGVGDHDTSTGE